MWRSWSGARFQLLLHNGGPHATPYRWADHVHQLTPVAANEARAAGHDPSRQTLLPLGVRFGAIPKPIATQEKAALRRRLGIPVDRRVVLSVGALNRRHKRMEYLISEIASLPEPRPFLVMLGQVESDTPAVRATADLYLGHGNYQMQTVDRWQVDSYYRGADVFALASLTEAFGLGLVEAMGHGLPCIAHDYPVARFVLGEEGVFADLRRPGALATRLADVFGMPDTAGSRARRHLSVKSRFGWAALAPAYVEMVIRCAAVGLASQAGPVLLQPQVETS
jgi:glycosyltransferase involved in cell wall biosynthesis